MSKRQDRAASSPKLRVKLRVQVMRAVGAWYLDEVRKHPDLEMNIDAETKDFFVSLSFRTGNYVELGRSFAERFANATLKTLGEKNPAALLQVEPPYKMPNDSDSAIAEICIAIKNALNRQKGGPQKLDPLLAYEANLKQKSKDLGVEGRLDWISAREDIGSVYNAFDCATSCSSYGEGFSNVIGEAMACEVPCVVTDVGDARWIVGDTGYLVGVDEPMALAAAWEKMLDLGSTERGRLGQKARERIVEHFSLDRLVDKTSSILDALVRYIQERMCPQ